MPAKKTLNQQSILKIANELGCNALSLPQIEKISVSVGLGQHKENKEIVESIGKEVALITGQKPKSTVAKKSISGFKLREGQHIGYVVTLRGRRMWQFLDKLVSAVLPRVRDFDGINEKSIDSSGNLSFALLEHSVFPEISPDEVREAWGMTITLVLNKKADKKYAKQYYQSVGIVF